MRKLLIIGTVLALLAGVCPVTAQEEFAAEMEEFRLAKEIYYNRMRAALIIMSSRPKPDDVKNALFEGERCVEVIEDLQKIVDIFSQSDAEKERMHVISAKAHILLAIYHHYNQDYTAATDEFEKAEELYPNIFDPVTGIEIERKAHKPRIESRNTIQYEYVPCARVKMDFSQEWGLTRMVNIILADFDKGELNSVVIHDVSPVPLSEQDRKLLEMANKKLTSDIADGYHDIRLKLGSGVYRISDANEKIFPFEFKITEASGPPIEISLKKDEWFELNFAVKKKKRPALMLNGMLMTELSRLPYGTYDFSFEDETKFKNAPRKVRFVTGGEENRTDGDIWTLVVPNHGSITLNVKRDRWIVKE